MALAHLPRFHACVSIPRYDPAVVVVSLSKKFHLPCSMESGANLLKQPWWSCVSLSETLDSRCSSPPSCLMGTCYLLGKVAGLICWPLDPQEYLQTLFVDPDHLCFDRTTYDNINGPGGPFMLDIIGPAGPLMYPDQISRYRPQERPILPFM